MIASSTKNRLRSNSKALWSLTLLFGLPVAARADALKYDWNLHYDLRYGYHLREPRDLATHRHTLETQQKLSLDSFTLVGDVRVYGEAAYASNPGRYQGPVVSQESQEVIPRDLFLQYKSDHLVIRLGNQQVVWGEAFGFFYADIVNPKDYRELGIGDLEAERVPSPMLNAKLILGDYSLQFLYVPKPFFNKLPALGSDFAAPFFAGVPAGTNLTVNNELTGPLALSDSELGARATALVSGGVDLSAFYLYYLDRMPYFQPRVTGPTSVTLDGMHARVHSAGVTATADLSTFLLRVEAVYTIGRMVSGATSTGFAVLKSDQATGVLGLDYTQLDKWRIGLQVSETYLTEDISTPIYPRSLPLVSLHVNGTTWKDHSLDVVLSYILNDGSSLTEVRYWVPASDQLEIGAGVDLWQGGRSSQFGQFQQASRGYAMLKAYFNK